jgi:hypothetical protein
MRLAGYHRSWPTYGADTIERDITSLCCNKRRIYVYRGFNPQTEMLSFGLPLYSELRIPTRIDRIKQWIIKKLS